jgi:iron(III) transport system ATP-binding protein
MDEPFSGLDSRLRDAIREETLAVMRETRATCIVVTHDPEEAMRMADRIVLMREGRIAQIGTPRDLYQAPADLDTARFFSDVNEVPGIVQGGRLITPVGYFAAPGLAEGALGGGGHPAAVDPAQAGGHVRARTAGFAAISREKSSFSRSSCRAWRRR